MSVVQARGQAINKADVEPGAKELGKEIDRFSREIERLSAPRGAFLQVDYATFVRVEKGVPRSGFYGGGMR